MQVNSLNLKKTNLILALLIFVAMGGAAFAQTPSAQTNASPAPERPSDTQKETSKKTSSKTPTKTAKSTKKKDTDLSASAEPDKVLYNRAMMDYKRGKYTEERLSLQTLINTYPDSEYLAKAKLATGDSYYKEGGVSNLTQSIAEYKDFITFFPFLDESAYAQMQVAMAHYRMMEKADRDTSQAQAAEQEFQTFLLKYPSNPLVPKAQQRLRNVQEVLADGEFRIATFYYLKGVRSYRAALARLNDVIERYPLYSQADKALWMAGGIYDKAERRETADQLYARIVREYPSSRYAPDAKRKLAEAGVPIPNADEKAVALVAANKGAAQSRPNIMNRGTGLIRTGPDFSKAARAGDPNLTPPDDNQSATDVLRPGAGGPTFSTGAGGGTGNSVAVEQVQPTSDSGSGSGSDSARPATIQPGTTAVPATPAESSSAGAAPSSGDSSSLPAPMSPDAAPADAGTEGTGGAAGAEPAAAPAGGAAADPASNSPARPVVDSKEDTTTASDAEAAKVIKGGSVETGGAPKPANAPAAAPAPAAPAATPASTTPGTTPGATAPDAQAKATSSESASQKSEKPDPSTESSSKKKKGIKKVIPW
jgi:outer membrane protein assembly factor BamD